MFTSISNTLPLMFPFFHQQQRINKSWPVSSPCQSICWCQLTPNTPHCAITQILPCMLFTFTSSVCCLLQITCLNKCLSQDWCLKTSMFNAWCLFGEPEQSNDLFPIVEPTDVSCLWNISFCSSQRPWDWIVIWSESLVVNALIVGLVFIHS